MAGTELRENGEVTSAGGSLGRLQALGAAVQVKPGLAAAGPPLRQGARSEKQEERRKTKHGVRKRITEGGFRGMSLRKYIAYA